jgi:hypothetical protein
MNAKDNLKKDTLTWLILHGHICHHMLIQNAQKAQQNEQNMFIRKAQGTRDGLYLNLPNEWVELMDIKKSNPLSCSIIQNDTEFYLLVSKVQEAL